MNRNQSLGWVFGLLTIFALASLGTSQEPTVVQRDSVELQGPIEVQTRGPIHEAFAQPFDATPGPGAVVPKEPPPPIPEEAPDQRPEAENAQWVPGYWAWDSERQDYMWVSGVYRVPPQGRAFVPGYWQGTDNGWRWVAGFWSGANQQDLPYTPDPPATLDDGPSMPAPDDNSAYIPGLWIYRESRFVWRPGYYTAVQPGRVWAPSTYAWTPQGYLFVDGYWDYPLQDRGLMFAPVYFNQPLWRNAGWRYRPNFVIGFDAFLDSAFVGGGGFYFGNYYDPRYARSGFRPWYAGRGRYDPVFAHHGWQNHRNNPNWLTGVQQTYAGRTSGRIAAPPRTLAQQSAFVKTRQGTAGVMPLNQAGKNQARLVTATSAQVAAQRTQAQQIRQVAANRQRADAVAFNQRTPGSSFRVPAGRTLSLPAIRDTSARPTTKNGLPRQAPNVPPKNPSTPRVVTPRSVTPAVSPRIETPRGVAPPARTIPPTAPRVAPTAPRVAPTAPRVAPTAPRVAPTAPRVAPARKAAAPQSQPRTVTRSVETPGPRATTTRSSPPRASASAQSRPVPARSSPPARPANNRKR